MRTSSGGLGRSDRRAGIGRSVPYSAISSVLARHPRGACCDGGAADYRPWGSGHSPRDNRPHPTHRPAHTHTTPRGPTRARVQVAGPERLLRGAEDLGHVEVVEDDDAASGDSNPCRI